jgi:hypothetical protein
VFQGSNSNDLKYTKDTVFIEDKTNKHINTNESHNISLFSVKKKHIKKSQTNDGLDITRKEKQPKGEDRALFIFI